MKPEISKFLSLRNVSFVVDIATYLTDDEPYVLSVAFIDGIRKKHLDKKLLLVRGLLQIESSHMLDHEVILLHEGSLLYGMVLLWRTPSNYIRVYRLENLDMSDFEVDSSEDYLSQVRDDLSCFLQETYKEPSQREMCDYFMYCLDKRSFTLGDYPLGQPQPVSINVLSTGDEALFALGVCLKRADSSLVFGVPLWHLYDYDRFAGISKTNPFYVS